MVAVGLALALALVLGLVEVGFDAPPEAVEGTVVCPVVAAVWLPLADECFEPTYANTPNRTAAATTIITVVTRRGRWFIESKAWRWARSVRETGFASPDPSRAYRSRGRASSKTSGCLGVGEFVVPSYRDRRHRSPGADTHGGPGCHPGRPTLVTARNH